VSDNSILEDNSGFAKNEPVVVGHFVTWLLVNVGALIVGHTHLVTATEWGSFATGITPMLTAVLLAVLATVLRRYVAPAWKSFQKWTQDQQQPVPAVGTSAGSSGLPSVTLDQAEGTDGTAHAGDGA